MQGSDARRPPTDDAPAAIGPYRLLAPLGRGGMGVVYRAQHVETGALVALKTVTVSDINLLSGIRREIHALRRVEHPGVVRIVDEGVESGLPWYAMELLEGRTLRDHNSERWRNQTTAEASLEATDRAFAEMETQYAQTGAAPSVSPLRAAREGSAASGSEPPSRPEARQPLSTRAVPPRRGHTPLSPGNPAGLAAPGMPVRTFRRAAAGELKAMLTLFRAICRPLAYIHGLGLVHRDLKPENVFIREDGAPVLVDFGLVVQLEGARARGPLDLQFGGKPMGSPSYMAPEQIRGDLVDARADLYALGCMLYEAVTGTVPYVGATSAMVLSMHLYGSPAPASDVCEDVPAALDSLLLRLLQKRPEDRLGYADDLAAALAELGAGEIGEVDPAASARAAPPPEPYLYRPGLAGRTDALRQLFARLQRLQEGSGGVAFLGGESGIGKTRLAMEVATEAARLGIPVVTGECVAVSASESGERGGVRAAPLHPFRNLLVAVADRCRAEGTAAYDHLLGPRGRLLAPYEPVLAQLPDHERYPEPPPLPAEAARYRLRSAVAETIAALAGEAPLVLVIDDLQWADDSSLGVLELLDRGYFDENRVLIVGAYRTEEVTPALEALAGSPDALHIQLGRLDARAVARVVSDMLAMDHPPQAFVDFLVQQSEGNPFFIAEYLRAAVQDGLLYRDGHGAWRLRPELGGSAGASPAASSQHAPVARPGSNPPEAPIALPGSLRELVSRRLAALSPGARALVRMASVLGRELEEPVLLAAAARDPNEAMEALGQLDHRQVLEEAGAGNKLRFVHDKLREIAYAEIPEDERLRLHAAAARAIEARHAGSADLALAYPQLAHHFAMAGAADKALLYLEKAGEQALATGASGEAREFYGRALALDDARPPAERAPKLLRARWERKVGQASYNLGELREAERRCVTALSLLGRPAAAIFEAREQRGAATLTAPAAASVWQLGRQLLHLAGLPIRPARSPEERERLSEASLAAELLAQSYFFQNQATLAFMASLEATNAAAGLGSSPALARGYATLSIAFGYVPWPGVVRAYARRAEEVAAAAEDVHTAAFVDFMMAVIAIGEGRLEDARAAAARSEQGAARVGDRRRQEECAALLGTVAHFRGAWVESLSRFDALQVSARRTSNAQGLVWGLSGRAQTLMLLGEGEEAVGLINEAEAALERSGDRAQQITLGQVAQAHLLRGDRAAARRVAERTLSLVRRGQPAAFHALHGYVAACEVLLGHWEEATAPDEREAAARAAREACRALGRYARIFPLGRPDALRFAGVVDWLEGRPRRAHRRWEQAIDEATRRDLPLHEAWARFELRRLPADDPDRRWQLERAEEIFEGLGIRYWQRRVAAARVTRAR